MKIRDIIKGVDPRNVSAYPMSLPDVQMIVGSAINRLHELNQEYNTDVSLSFLSIGDLSEIAQHHEKINIDTQGFVDHSEPWNIYMVPVNIYGPNDASDFIEHEYQHVLDLTCEPGGASCPLTIRYDDELREERAKMAEEIGQPLHPAPISTKPAEANWEKIQKLKGEFSTLLLALDLGIRGKVGRPLINVLNNLQDKLGEIRTEVAKGVSFRQGSSNDVSPKKPDFPVGRDGLLMAMANMVHAEVHLVNILPDLAQKIRKKRKELEHYLWGDTSDGLIVKDCPFCAIKHLLLATVYLWEAPSFGAENVPVEYLDMFGLAQELDGILIKQQDFAQKFLVK